MSNLKKPVVEIINNPNSERDHLEKEQENTDWFALARKLRQDNRQIIKTLLEKEEELAVVKEQLQAKIIKLEKSDILISQQSEDLNITQETVNSLRQELTEIQKILKTKEEENEKLVLELREQQKQISSLESQCDNLENNYQKEKEKGQILAEKLKELELRLQREQRHNLQFKAALNQCLEKPEEVYPLNIKTKEEKTEPLISSQSPIPKTHGIQPWSEELEEPNLLVENPPKEALESSAEQLSFKETFIPKLKVLNEPLSTEIKENKFSPSPLINKSNSRRKSVEKRQIMLPRFPKLNLNNEG